MPLGVPLAWVLILAKLSCGRSLQIDKKINNTYYLFGVQRSELECPPNHQLEQHPSHVVCRSKHWQCPEAFQRIDAFPYCVSAQLKAPGKNSANKELVNNAADMWWTQVAHSAAESPPKVGFTSIVFTHIPKTVKTAFIF